MIWVIDRIVNGRAICECLESGETRNISLPKGAKEGHVLRQDGEGFIVDHNLTKQRKGELKTRLNRLFEK